MPPSLLEVARDVAWLPTDIEPWPDTDAHALVGQVLHRNLDRVEVHPDGEAVAIELRLSHRWSHSEFVIRDTFHADGRTQLELSFTNHLGHVREGFTISPEGRLTDPEGRELSDLDEGIFLSRLLTARASR